MRKILAAMIIVTMLCSVSYAARFTSFPGYGVCTGDRVRCRQNPGTKSKVLGHINKGVPVRVEAQRTVKGELWYELYTEPDSEFEEGPFWVSARYIEPER